MNIQDRLREALHAYRQVIQPTRELTYSGDAVHARNRSWVRAAIPAVTAVALVASVIVSVRLLAPSDSETRLSQSPPTPLPTITPSPSPTPESSPTEAPTPAPGRFVSPDGTWEFQYPPTWSLRGATPIPPDPGAAQGWTWSLKNYTTTTDSGVLTDGKLKIDLRQISNDQNQTLDDLMAVLCSSPEVSQGREQPSDCKKVDLNGRTWASAVHTVTSGEGKGARFLSAATVANGYIYSASGLSPAGPRHGTGFQELETIVGSFVVRDK